MIDAEGFRANIGIILVNRESRLFWARRIGQRNAWQFPQGGMKEKETFEDALYRELTEEIGLTKSDVEILARTKDWVRYRLPKQFIRHHSQPLCIGQKQRWFLLRLVSDEKKIHLDHSETPEFDNFRWVDFWYPQENVVSFKRTVYRQVLEEFAPIFGI